MAIMRKFQNLIGGKADNETEDPVAVQMQILDKEAAVHAVDEVDLKKPVEDAQNGVQKIEAVTLAWSKSSLYLVLCLYILTLYVFPDCETNIAFF
jgi:hypothetical protein